MTAATSTSSTVRYPFSAVVGHDDLRLGLLLNAVYPRIGGVLVRGEKGTAKSTIVRALASLLPAVDVVENCRFGCDPSAPDSRCPDGPHDGEVGRTRRAAQLVELPVGASEDRLVGSLDVERALTEGVRAYQPGLLAAAHRGVLYVDEVNLLHDHLVDLLLDAAAMGRAHVEREGVSLSHAASFLLVGTMNPEEGELRPQLLDRFGLTVQVSASREVETRTEVVRRRLRFDADPVGFSAEWAESDAELARRIADARSRVDSVELPSSEVRRIASVCASFEVDGMRADLVLARAAVAHAAWRGVNAVAATDVEAAARLALPHRRRRDPFDEPGMDEQQLQQALEDAEAEVEAEETTGGETSEGTAEKTADPGGSDGESGSDGSDGSENPEDGPEDDDPGGGVGGSPDGNGPDGGPGGGAGGNAPSEGPSGENGTGNGPGSAPEERTSGATEPDFRARMLEIPGLGEGAPGRRSRSRSRTGQVVRASAVDGHGVHLQATLAAAAPHQCARGRSGPGLRLRPEDLRHGVREGREGNLVLFAVDASGSMAARERMSAVSGAVLALLRDAYQRRDKVGVVTFRGTSGEVALPPTSSVDTAAARMRKLPTGGKTPLADGLLTARRVIRTERMRDPQRRPLLVVLTDGKATVGVDPGGERANRGRKAVDDALRSAGLLAELGVASVVVDCESGPIRLGLADRLARGLGAPNLQLSELSADNVAGVVRAARTAGPVPA